MAPSVGPVQGSQATANARPAMIGPPVRARRMSSSGRHSRFSFGTNSVAMNSAPISAITTPDTWRSTARFSDSVCPSPVALIPSATNITVKARQNSSAGPSTLPRPRPSWMSANDTPEIVER
jgi:hypothetical protein